MLVLLERLCACCVTCFLSPVLATGAAWSSLSPVGILTNPKPLGLALLSGPQQYKLCVSCDCLVRSLPDKQQWKIKKPSTDKPSLITATSHWCLWDCRESSLSMVWKTLWSQKQPRSLGQQLQGFGGSAQGQPCHQAVSPAVGTLWRRPCVSWHVVLALGWGAGRRQGSRSQNHCLSLKVATVWCSCVVAVPAQIRPIGRDPCTYRAHVETEHHQLNHCWERTIIVWK